MPNRILRILLVLCLCLLVGPSLIGQVYNPFNQRDDKYRLLGLKRAKEAFEVARSEFDRQKELHDRGLITIAQLDQSRNVFSDAEVNYQQSLLAVLFEEQYVSVTKATKYQTKDGLRHVRLTIANTSGGSAEFRKLLEVEDALFRSLQPDVVNNVYVSLMNDGGAIISQPYETKIEELRYGAPQELDFTLLQDLDAVTVYLIFSNGSQRNMKIFLQKDVTVNRVAVQSEQFSQEIDLGKSSSFDLTLELYSGSHDTYGLEVVNLPKEIGRFFKDPSGSVRLSQLKFTESTRTKRAALEIAMPDRPAGAVVMDQPITFYAIVIPREQQTQLTDLQSRQWSEEELDQLDVGYVKLEVVPRGKGELLVRAPLLFHSVTPGEIVATSIDLFNEGSHRIDNIEIQVDLPLNWRKTLTPNLVPKLEIAEEARIDLTFTPPEDIAEGKYDVRLRTSGTSNNQPVTGEDKTVTVEVRASANVIGSALIILLLVIIIGGMVMFGVRLSRR